MDRGPANCSTASVSLLASCAIVAALSLPGRSEVELIDIELPVSQELVQEQEQEQDEAAPDPPAPPPVPPDSLRDRVARRAQAQALIAELAAADDEHVIQIELQLAGLGDEAMVALKLASLGSDFDVRRSAARLADRVRWRRVMNDQLLTQHPALIDTMAGGDETARAAAVDALAASADAATVPLLRECLADAQPYVSRRAMDALVAVGKSNESAKPAVTALLLQRLSDQTQPEPLLATVHALAQLGEVPVEPFARLLDNPSDELRRSVLLALGHSRKAQAVPAVARMLDDRDWRVRAAALEALEGLTRDDKAKAQIAAAALRALDDPDEFVRASAVRLVGASEHPGAAARLHELMAAGRLSEEVALDTLVRMKDDRARTMLLQRYHAATDDGERLHWLTLLAGYSDDAAVDALLQQVLADPARRTTWAQTIGLIGWRRSGHALVPQVAAMFEDEDPAVGEAAWTWMRYHLDEYQLPAAQLDRMFASPRAQQRLWAQSVVYVWNGDDLWPRLATATRDADPAVAAYAIALLSAHHLQEPFDAEAPESRRNADRDVNRMMLLMGSGRASAAVTSPVAPSPDWTGTLAPLLDHADDRVRTLAAAVLYRGRFDQGDTVAAILTRSLVADDDGLRAAAMAGIQDQPGPFLDRLDLEALSAPTAPPAVRNRALIVLAASDRPQHMDLLLQRAAGADLAANRTLFVALARAADPRAHDLIVEAWSKMEQYEQRRMLESLKGQNTSGVAALLLRLRSVPRVERYVKSAIDEVAITLDDPAALPLLVEIARRPAQDYYDNQQQAKLLLRIVALDRAQGVATLVPLLAHSDEQRQVTAMAVLMQLPPRDDLIEPLVTLARNPKALSGPYWLQVASWLPPEAIAGRFLPVLDELSPAARMGLLQRLVSQARAPELPLLIGARTTDAHANVLLAMSIAAVTAERPALQPDLAKLDTAALPNVLTAAGAWREGVAKAMAYVDHADAAVANAARRGLALAALAGDGPLDDAQRRVLLQAVADADAVVAYLAAEALWQRDAAALQAVTAESISTDAAKLRHAAACGAQATAEQRAFVQRQLQQPALASLAIDAVRAGAGPDKVLMSQAMTAWPHVVGRLAVERGDATTVKQAIDWGVLDAADPAVRQAMAPLIDAARKSEGKDAMLGDLAARGLLDPPQPGDLMSLIRTIHYHPPGQYLHGSYYYHGSTSDGTSVLDIVLQWAGDAPDDAIVARASPDTIGGVVSAATAAIRWNHEPAIAPLVTAAAGQSKESGKQRQQAAQRIALQALAIIGHPTDAAPLIEHLASFNPDDHDWQQQMLRQQIVGVITRLDPVAAAPLWSSSSQARRYYHLAQQSGSTGAADLILLWLDLPPDRRPTAAWDAAMSAMSQQGDDRATLAKTLTNHREYGGPFETSSAFRMPWTVADMTQSSSPDDKVRMLVQWVTSGSDEEADDDADDIELDWSGMMTAQVHAGGDDDAGAVAFYLSDVAPSMPYAAAPPAVVEALRPLLGHEDEAIRIRAMRAAGEMRLDELATDIAHKLRDGSMRVRTESAWALGAIRGRAAVDAVAAALRAASDFDERVELACVLRLLGSDAGAVDLRRAVELTAAQLVLQRAMALADADPQPRRAGRRASMFAMADETDTVAVTLPWRAALTYAAPDLLGPRLDRLALPGESERTDAAAPPPRADLSRLSVAMDGQLSLPGRYDHALPLAPLCDLGATPMAARLCAAEAWLEPVFFVQFADQAKDVADLRRRWAQWYAAHGDQPREQWWRQAVESATAELTDARWWHRARAAARLRRLTGRVEAAPNLFDLPKWTTWQNQWRAWLATPEAMSPQSCLIAAAAADQAIASNGDDAYLTDLVRLAGWGPDHLAEAALLQLSNWPDHDALVAAALDWQDCPNPALRQWVRDRARQRSGIHRLVYVEADLSPPP